ncbi:MAG: hypothetical protein KDB04_01235 [Acidimicrobiales bacterium]|nr:hypothetical protein [Acidimicrobiales bacterium]HRW37163.1 hypothetical protein [Aquihabitans sp.]
MAIPTAPIVAGSLVGGYLVARETKVRPLGGAVLLAGGLVAGRSWLRTAGAGRAVALTAIYLGGFGASHPLAKKVGAWPSVLGVAAVSGVSAWALADRRS